MAPFSSIPLCRGIEAIGGLADVSATCLIRRDVARLRRLGRCNKSVSYLGDSGRAANSIGKAALHGYHKVDGEEPAVTDSELSLLFYRFHTFKNFDHIFR